MTEPTTDPTPEAMSFWRQKVMPWLIRYSTTPSAQWDAEGKLLLDSFAQAAVEREREQAPAFRAAVEAVRSRIFYWMTRNHHRGEQSYALLGEAKESLTEALKAYEGQP